MSFPNSSWLGCQVAKLTSSWTPKTSPFSPHPMPSSSLSRSKTSLGSAGAAIPSSGSVLIPTALRRASAALAGGDRCARDPTMLQGVWGAAAARGWSPGRSESCWKSVRWSYLCEKRTLGRKLSAASFSVTARQLGWLFQQCHLVIKVL